jgi:hypothetical protein
MSFRGTPTGVPLRCLIDRQSAIVQEEPRGH